MALLKYPSVTSPLIVVLILLMTIVLAGCTNYTKQKEIAANDSKPNMNGPTKNESERQISPLQTVSNGTKPVAEKKNGDMGVPILKVEFANSTSALNDNIIISGKVKNEGTLAATGISITATFYGPKYEGLAKSQNEVQLLQKTIALPPIIVGPGDSTNFFMFVPQKQLETEIYDTQIKESTASTILKKITKITVTGTYSNTTDIIPYDKFAIIERHTCSAVTVKNEGDKIANLRIYYGYDTLYEEAELVYNEFKPQDTSSFRYSAMNISLYDPACRLLYLVTTTER